MNERHARTIRAERPADSTPAAGEASKQPWEEPKLTFVEPTLTEHGSMTGLTAVDGFFGTIIVPTE